MPLNEDSLVARVALRHSVSPEAVRTILRALRSARGTMAQFGHPEFGGMSRWSPGMTMVGDTFNNGRRSKLDAVCTELAAHAAETHEKYRADLRTDPGVSYRANQNSNWWPASLGTPTSVGAQNDLRYAIFPRRLVIEDGEHVEIYDTRNHRIFGVAQAQSADQALIFTSQDGLVRVKDLPKVQ
jgi:hypothetical protein